MRTRTPEKFTDAARAAYLEALEKLASHKAASAHIGVHYTTVWKWRQKDTAFGEACDAALGKHYKELLAVARTWAIEGIVEETYNKEGKVIAKRRRFSERILLKMLARLRPADWGDKVQVDQKGTLEVTDKRIRTEDMTPEQLRAGRVFLATLPDDAPERN